MQAFSTSIFMTKGFNFYFSNIYKRGYIFLIMLYVPLLAYSQYNRHWCLGDKLHLDFISSPPTVLSDSELIFDEAGVTISNKTGKLLFYVNHEKIYNSNHKLIINGDSIGGAGSITQGILTVPRPKIPNQYYLFVHGRANWTTADWALSYSIIDMNLNNGLGGISSTKMELISPSTQGIYFTEKLTAVKHANGYDWWIILHKRNSSEFVIYLATQNKIELFSTQAIGSQHIAIHGQMISSQQGEKIALVTAPGLLEIFDFNRCTGTLSNVQSIGDKSAAYYGCSFSPSGHRIYASTWSNFSNTRNIFQFNINDPDPVSTQTLIWQTTDPDDYPGQHLLGPDGNIYITHLHGWTTGQNVFSPNNQRMTVIHLPDSLGISCDLRAHSLDVSPRRTNSHLPNLPNFNLGPLPRPPANAGPNRTTTCSADSATIGTAAQAGYLYTWQPTTGLSNPNIAQPQASPNQTTTYTLTVIDTSRSCENISNDTVVVNYAPAPSTFSMDAGPDQTGCPGEALHISAKNNPNWHYKWSPEIGLDDPQKAQPTARLQYNQRYILRVTDPTELCEKYATDTVDIFIENPPYADAGPDILLCEGLDMADTLGVSPLPGAKYSWFPAFGLDDPFAAQPVVSTLQPQLYRLQVTVDTFCVSWDSVRVRIEPCTEIFVPSAISPNRDGINDVFIITNLPPGSRFQVWNRWGNRVFQSDSYGNDWQPDDLPEGVYVWRLQTQAGEDLRGTVTVIR